MTQSFKRLALFLTFAALVAACASWLSAASASAGVPARGNAAQHKAAHIQGPGGQAIANPPSRPYVVLYDQYNNPGLNSTSSQVFGPGIENLNDQAADDFIVPQGQLWAVNLVEVQGEYDANGGPADSVNVFFYANNSALPGTPVFTQTNVAYTPGPTAGSFVIPINPVSLPQGHYWLSVQANQDYQSRLQWFWTNRTTVSNNPAAWRNPLDGFGTGCRDWNPRGSGCGGDPTAPDQVFRLSGNITVLTATPTVTGTPPTATRTPSPTPTLCGSGDYVIAPTIDATIVPGTSDTGNHCIDCTSLVNLPFPYQLYDQVFTRARVDSNGTLQFLGNFTTFMPSCLPDLRYNFTIFPQWDDLDTADTSCPGGCGIYTSVSGSAPNRIFNIEWRTSYNSGAGDANFEVRLFEGETHFDIVYGTIMEAGLGAVVGVQRDTGSRSTQYECQDPGSITAGLKLAFTLPPCAAQSPTSTPTPGTGGTATPTRTPVVGTPTNTPTGPTQTVTPCAMNFSDVQSTDYFYTAVRYLYCAGIISGYSDGTFRPGAQTTRGQLTKIIVLARGWTLNCPSSGHFSDVLPGNVFYCFVETAFAHGIIAGYNDGTFRPGNNITRGQLSKVVVLAMNWTILCPATGHFSDVPTDSAFYCFVETAFSHGIISGYSDGTFRPGNNATRGQISTIVYRAVTSP